MTKKDFMRKIHILLDSVYDPECQTPIRWYEYIYWTITNTYKIRDFEIVLVNDYRVLISSSIGYKEFTTRSGPHNFYSAPYKEWIKYEQNKFQESKKIKLF